MSFIGVWMFKGQFNWKWLVRGGNFAIIVCGWSNELRIFDAIVEWDQICS